MEADHTEMSCGDNTRSKSSKSLADTEAWETASLSLALKYDPKPKIFDQFQAMK